MLLQMVEVDAVIRVGRHFCEHFGIPRARGRPGVIEIDVILSDVQDTFFPIHIGNHGCQFPLDLFRILNLFGAQVDVPFLGVPAKREGKEP